ncbi:MAG: SRPBCC family protein [Egibacteraceae bacterium]
MGTRFADGPSVEVEVYVDASPGCVWRLVTDISLPARFSHEYQGGEWVEGSDGPARGARFTGRNRHPAIGEWETTCTVVECAPERVFAWAVNDLEHPAASWRFELEPQASGTRLRQSARLGPGPSGLTWAIKRAPDQEERIVADRLDELRDNMLATLEGIKAIAEEQSP